MTDWSKGNSLVLVKKVTSIVCVLGISKALAFGQNVPDEVVQVWMDRAFRPACVETLSSDDWDGWHSVTGVEKLRHTHFRYVLEARAESRGQSLQEYLENTPETEVAQIVALRSLNSIGSYVFSYKVDFAGPAYSEFHASLEQTLAKRQGERLDIRVFGIGHKSVEVDALISVVKVLSARAGLTPEAFCKKHRLQFWFYDIRPRVLNALQERMDSLSTTTPWFAQRSHVRFINLTAYSLYETMPSQTTLLAFCRNTFRSEIVRKGKAVLDAFERISIDGGWFITDGASGRSIEEYRGPIWKKAFENAHEPTIESARPTSPDDYIVKIFRLARP